MAVAKYPTAAVSGAPAPARPQKEPVIGFTTLRLLRDKNLISQSEFDSALRSGKSDPGQHEQQEQQDLHAAAAL